jgi:DNA repair protein RecN (Recombination protein N)
MLKRLYISNFALINEMDVEFPGGLTVITGETGAGKSIFLEALGLALGKRAETSMLGNKTKKCIIEAEFTAKDLELGTFFEDFELEPDHSLIIRREINPDGKSRSFLNDGIVSLAALKALSDKLIDIHSQHQTLLLNTSTFQVELLDAWAGSLTLAGEYRTSFRKLSKLKSDLDLLIAEESRAKKELDFYQFLFQELDEAALKPGNLKSLEEEVMSLENAESIKTNLLLASSKIKEGDENALNILAAAKTAVASLAKYGKSYQELAERLNSVYIELKELSNDLEAEGTGLQLDNERLLEINEKLDRYSRLLKKHNVKTEEELLSIKEEIGLKLEKFDSLETQIQELRSEIQKEEKICLKRSEELTQQRKLYAPELEKAAKSILAELSLENAELKIEINPAPLSPSGADLVRFLFSANKGIAVSELHKVASGGELSRLMLTLKSLMASKKKLATIIFDEIDTGVSGEVADRIGKILKAMGDTMQVVAITHLPQMASKGKHHLFVYKMDNEEKTVSHIRQLTKDERVNEIAKMLSTGNPSQSALKNAKELLSVN